MLAEGRYRGRPVAAALGLSGTGKEQIAVAFDFVEPAGTRLTWYGFFTDDTTDRTVEALRACGWKGDDLSVFVEGSPLPEGVDQEVELVVQQQEYPAGSGQVSARIAFVNSGGGLALKTPLTREQATAFATRMKSRIGALDRASGRAASPRGPAAQKTAERYAARAAPAPGFVDVPEEVMTRSAPEGDDSPFSG